MIPSMVRNQIESSLSAHKGRAAFAERLNAIAEDQGVFLFSDDLEGMFVLAERYVRGTLHLMENCEIAAQQARVESMFDPLIDACGRFFLHSHPETPDQKGLLGMVCDSFLARSLLAIASERMQAVRGFPLLATNPHSEAQVVRGLIGATLADRLHQIAETAHDSPQIRFYTNSAYLLQGPLRASAALNESGSAWEDDAIRFATSIGLKLDPVGRTSDPQPVARQIVL